MVWYNLDGTTKALYAIGKGGPNLRHTSGELELRNSADSAFATFRADRVKLEDGSFTDPSLAFDDGAGNWDTGFYLQATDTIGILVAGSPVARWNILGLGFGASATSSVSLAMDSKTNGISLPNGSTAQRAGLQSGKIRYNTDNSVIEWSDGSSWYDLPTGASLPNYYIEPSTGPATPPAIGTGGDSNQIAIGNSAEALTDRAIAFGNNSRAGDVSTGGTGADANPDSIAIGTSTQSLSINSIAIGTSTVANGSHTISIGSDITGNSGSQTIVIGRSNSAIHTDSVLIGNNISSSGNNSVSIGDATSARSDSVAIGSDAIADGNPSIAIGFNVDAFSPGNIAIGRNTVAGVSSSFAEVDAIAIGAFARAIALEAIAIGDTTKADDEFSIAIGADAQVGVGGTHSIALGTNISTSNPNEVVIGANGNIKLTMESDGTLNVANTANYETLVTADDDIPNKRYVDDEISGSLTNVVFDNATSNFTAGYTSDVFDYGLSGTGTVAATLTDENLQTLTIDGSFTLDPPAAGNGVSVILATVDATGGYTVTTSGFTHVIGVFDTTANTAHLLTVYKIGTTSILRIEIL